MERLTVGRWTLPPGPAAPSLGEVHRTVAIPEGSGFLRKFLIFSGPALLVSVGYMDPGNWATALAGGSRFGYSLLWVVLVSSLMALLLQTLTTRLGLVTGRDLAQACREAYPPPVVWALWLLCEVAIVACDLAELIGSAVALNLLLGIPLLLGVGLTALDVLLLLGLVRFGFRKLEAVVLVLVGTIGACFAWEIALASPAWPAVLRGLLVPSVPGPEALLLGLGILGATVMPHNLYLHSSLVQSRAWDRSPEGLREALRHNALDTFVSLGSAFFVNAALMVLAAAVFHGRGEEVGELQKAHELLTPLLGGGAATLFALALLASGQSSTITGTLAGQVVMEGFLDLRMAPWKRRVLTRGLALVPALALVGLEGGGGTVHLLVLSQVVLSMQLPFALFPLVQFTSDPRRMGPHANSPFWRWVGYGVSWVIVGLNLYLLAGALGPAWLAGLLALPAAFAAWLRFVYRAPDAGAPTSP